MSVSYLIHGTNSLLERAIGSIYVKGEVASLKRAPSGHFYFTLLDEKAQISCVIWRGDAGRLKHKPKDGDVVIGVGRLGVFERDGRFQLYVRQIEHAGAGQDALLFEKLKKKLFSEGLFDSDKKRPLPPIPRRVGVVTSKTGAAVRDIINAIQRRFPIPILIADARVQGVGSANEIIAGIQRLCHTDVDVIIVGRGGGSAVDLSVFNDEGVVRAIAACPIPIISAVGHEVDISLSDLAADVRAATPTMAGELVAPVREELRQKIVKQEKRLTREIAFLLRNERQRLDRLIESISRMLEGRLHRCREQLSTLLTRIEKNHPKTKLLDSRKSLILIQNEAQRLLMQRLNKDRQIYRTLVAKLETMSPLAVLNRGYALAVIKDIPIKDAAHVDKGDKIDVRLAKGQLTCIVEQACP